MQRKKAVFFDIDGTLFEVGRPVPESTIKAIGQLRENGHLAFICSGRSRIMIPQTPILDIGFDGIVAACGMYASLGDEVLFQEEMSYRQLSDMLPILQETETMYILEGTEYIYYDENTIHHAVDDWYVQSIKKVSQGHFIPVPEQIEDICACKISLQLPGHGVDEIMAAAGEQFDVLIHQGDIAEVVPRGVSKAEGIRKVCEKLGIDREDTVAVGDSINDVDMLRFAGTGIAMGNGTPVAKEAADYVTTGLYEDGIWNGLAYLGLLEQ